MTSADNNRIPIPNILERATERLRIQYKNNSDILGYRVRVANSLDNAYGPDNGVGGAGTFALFDMDRDRGFISKEMRRKKLNRAWTATARGQTMALFNPNEYLGLDPVVPSDGQLLFVRTQVRTQASPAFPGAANNLNQSDILVVRTPDFNSVPRPAITLGGTAPSLAGVTLGLPAPEEAMVFHLPAYGDAMVLTNHGPGDLYYSVGYGLPLVRVPAGSDVSLASGMKDELTLCGDGANPEFSLVISTVTGVR